jgi:hypothetical protein
MDICGIIGNRTDVGNCALQVPDRKKDLDDFGGWNIVLPLLCDKIVGLNPNL